MTIEKYKCKDFPATGVVRTPKKWRVKFGMIPGELVDVVYEDNVIFIRKEDPSSLHNKRFVQEDGYVCIPKEIIHLADITHEKEYCLYVDEENEEFLLKVLGDGSDTGVT